MDREGRVYEALFELRQMEYLFTVLKLPRSNTSALIGWRFYSSALSKWHGRYLKTVSWNKFIP